MTAPKIMQTGYNYKEIWRVAWPVLISSLMEQLMGITDTAFLGRVGEIELGASAIASTYYLAFFMLGLGFSIGAQVIIARRNGEGNFAQTGQTFFHGLYFLAAFASIIIVISEIVTPTALHSLCNSYAIAKAATGYVRWRLIGIIFAFATVMFRAFFTGTTQTKTLTINSIVMVLSNIFFNWILIFGHLGMPALGIEGAAIGSTLAELVSLVFFVVFTRTRIEVDKYGLRTPPKPSLTKTLDVLRIAGWVMVQYFCSIFTWMIFFVFIEHLGEIPLAISNVIRSVSGIVFIVINAMAATTSTLVSNIIGAGHANAVRSVVMRCMKLTALLCAAIIGTMLLSPQTVLRIYTDNAQLIEAAVPAMIVMFITYIPTVPGFILFNGVVGTGHTQYTFAIEMMSIFIYLIYCIIVIEVMKADVAVCWFADAIYAIGLSLGSLYFLKNSIPMSGRAQDIDFFTK